MLYVHCNDCHHEWECTCEDERTCEWCGGYSYILEDNTPLSLLLCKNSSDVIKRLKRLKNPYADKIIEKIEKHCIDDECKLEE